MIMFTNSACRANATAFGTPYRRSGNLGYVKQRP
nr:MAG TPA: hypothetical protein [Caudoviricetes sp.]DAM92528.1 MAG TPA: hypothetical protein [Caudoviricetes sp.]